MKLRLVATDLNKFNTATVKLLSKGFELETIPEAGVRDEDVTFDKIGIFLEMVKA